MASSLIEPIACVGFAARGAVYVMIGVLAALAAAGQGVRTTGASGAVRAIGRLEESGALRTLQAQEYGAWLLGIVALGLVSYGLLSLVDARYRRILR